MDLTQLVRSLGGVTPIDGATFAPFSEHELEEFESALSTRFPDSYRLFLTTYGACAAGKTVSCPVKKGSAVSSKAYLAVFYGANNQGDNAYSIVRRVRYFKERIPETLVPIADNGMGSQFCLGIRGAEIGKIYYWDIQRESLDEADYLEEYGSPRPREAKYANVYPVADSFEDFLDRLVAESE